MEECFIAIVPPEPVLTKLSTVMKNISTRLSSNKALIFPPHITLVHRFRTEKYVPLIRKLKSYCQAKKPFKVRLLKCGHFETPPIIFVESYISKVVHLELLELVKYFRTPWVRESFLKGKFNRRQQKYILDYGSPYVKEFYNSHITIAGPDVDIKEFKFLLREGLPKISESFLIKEIVVLKNESGNWNISDRIKLENKHSRNSPINN